MKDITIEASESVVCEVYVSEVAEASQGTGLQGNQEVVAQVQALQ